jgi:hypothetical protein
MTHIPDHHIEQALRFGYDPEQEAQLVHDNSAIPMVKRDTLEGVCVGLMWATNVHDDPEYDLASAMAGVDAILTHENVTLVELAVRLMRDVLGT